jgi:hypothetical protein
VKEIRNGRARRLTVRTGWDVASWLRGSGSRDDAWAAPASQCCILLSHVEGSTPLIARVPEAAGALIERAVSIIDSLLSPKPDEEQTHEITHDGAGRQLVGVAA